MQIQVPCPNIQATQSLACSISKIAKQGDIFLLYGTLGVGKSVFARAFIQNLTDAKEVPSPTFTLLQSYTAPDFEIYHFDLYRLKNAEEIWELNIEEALYTGVSLIEWPEKMGPYIPRDVFKISVVSSSDNVRLFNIEVNSEEKQMRLKKILPQKE